MATKKAPAKKDKEPESSGTEPHDINDMLASDRMKALLEDHRRMGSRP